MNFVIELGSGLVTAREPFRNVCIPEIVHIETNHAIPLDSRLLDQGIQERDLAFSGSEDHADIFLPFQETSHLVGHSRGRLLSQILLVLTDDNLCSSVVHCGLLNNPSILSSVDARRDERATG